MNINTTSFLLRLKYFSLVLASAVVISCGSDNSNEQPKEAPVERLILTKAEIVDGTIFIHWKPLNKINFDIAVLRIYNSKSLLKEVELSKETIASLKYNDNTSINQNLSYSITLSNLISDIESNTVSLLTDPIEVREEILSGNQIKITLSQHPIFKNFDYYKYQINTNEIAQMDPRGGEFIMNFKYVFGEKSHRFTQKFGLYRNNEDLPLFEFQKYLFFGNSFDKKFYQELIFSPSHNAYFALEVIGESHTGASREVYVHKLNPNNLSTLSSKYLMTLLDNYFFDLTIDPSSNNLIVDFEEKTILTNPNDLSIIHEWNISDYYTFDQYNTYTLYRDGIIVVREAHLGGKAYIYKKDTKEVIYNEIVGDFGLFSISDDGKYFYNDQKIYRLDYTTNSYTILSTTDFAPNSIEFLLNQNKCIYSHQNYDPIIYDIGTNSYTQIKDLLEVSQLQYDEKTQKILLGQLHYSLYAVNGINMGARVNIYNLDDNSQKKIEVYHTHRGELFRFLNNKLIFSDGIYLDGIFN